MDVPADQPVGLFIHDVGSAARSFAVVGNLTPVIEGSEAVENATEKLAGPNTTTDQILSFQQRG